MTASLQGNTLRATTLNAFLYVKIHIIKNFEDLTLKSPLKQNIQLRKADIKKYPNITFSVYHLKAFYTSTRKSYTTRLKYHIYKVNQKLINATCTQEF